MGIKKLFKTKPDPEPTQEQNREELMTQGIQVKSERDRKDKFSAFKDYARNKNGNREELKPRVAGQHNNNNSNNNNPYSHLSANGAHSYGDLNETRTNSSPYSRPEHALSDTGVSNNVAPFNPYAQQSQQQQFNGQQNGRRPQPQQQQQQQQNYGRQRSPYGLDRVETNQTSATQYTKYDQQQSQLLQDNATIYTSTDLNEPPNWSQNQVAVNEEEEDLNEVPQEYQDETDFTEEELERLRLAKEEDEAVDQIKQDIRFTKQQSVASTRNTLRMAEEAYASGQNTLGMLGSQSERLYGVQRNLALADVQNKMAEDKTKEMAKLNRSIFAVHASNPFNSKSRLRAQEEKIKQGRLNEKLLHDRQRAEIQSSERRVLSGLRDDSHHTSTTGDIYNKYNDQRILEQAKRYQFENDEEDDDMEREIHQNLNAIGNHATNLKKMAMTIGKETESQNKRMNDIEEDADKLDINVHLNNHRLNGMH